MGIYIVYIYICIVYLSIQLALLIRLPIPLPLLFQLRCVVQKSYCALLQQSCCVQARPHTSMEALFGKAFAEGRGHEIGSSEEFAAHIGSAWKPAIKQALLKAAEKHAEKLKQEPDPEALADLAEQISSDLVNVRTTMVQPDRRSRSR